MKVLFFALFLFVAVSAYTPEQKQALSKYSDECEKESGVNPDLVKKFRTGDFSVEDEKLNLYAFCMYRKDGLVTPEGVYLKKEVVSKYGNEKAMDICIPKVMYASAFAMEKCYNAHITDHDTF